MDITKHSPRMILVDNREFVLGTDGKVREVFRQGRIRELTEKSYGNSWHVISGVTVDTFESVVRHYIRND